MYGGGSKSTFVGRCYLRLLNFEITGFQGEKSLALKKISSLQTRSFGWQKAVTMTILGEFFGLGFRKWHDSKGKQWKNMEKLSFLTASLPSWNH